MERDAKSRSVRFRLQLGALVAVGGVLGTIVAEPPPRAVAAFVWAAATALGFGIGLLAFLAFADLFLSKGEDDDVISRLAGGRLMKASVVFGAVGLWIFLLSKL